MSDPEIQSLLAQELTRQRSQLNLIASENYVSPSILALQGNVATNKYAEGKVGKRYYSGCEWVDRIETLAVDRAKKLFDVGHVNVQVHAGSQANLAVMMALMSPGDAYMGLSLSHGGHLSHGSPVNVSGQFYRAQAYHVGADGRIDFDEVEAVAKKCQPKIIIAGYSAYSRIIDWRRFRSIADEVGAYLLADIAHTAGLIAAGVFPSPVPFAHVITTTTHKTLRGPRGAMIMLPKDQIALADKVDKAVFPGIQGGPMMHTIAAKASAFWEASQPGFKLYQQQVLSTAKAMAKAFSERGLPVVSGGTDCHQFTLDLSQATELSGAQVEKRLESANVLVNKNAIPFDKRSVWQTSGVRIGAAAAVTRGLSEDSMLEVVEGMSEVILAKDPEGAVANLRSGVAQLLSQHELYPSLA